MKVRDVYQAVSYQLKMTGSRLMSEWGTKERMRFERGVTKGWNEMKGNYECGGWVRRCCQKRTKWEWSVVVK